MTKLTKNKKLALSKVEVNKAYKLQEAADLMKALSLLNLMLQLI
jgi:hypothetical protein